MNFRDRRLLNLKDLLAQDAGRGEHQKAGRHEREEFHGREAFGLAGSTSSRALFPGVQAPGPQRMKWLSDVVLSKFANERKFHQ